MASESSNEKEQTWNPLPSMPRISVASSSRARLAHRRPISISLSSKISSSVPHSSGLSCEVLNSIGQSSSAVSAEVYPAVSSSSSLTVDSLHDSLASADIAKASSPTSSGIDTLPVISSASHLERTFTENAVAKSSDAEFIAKFCASAASGSPIRCDSRSVDLGSPKTSDDSYVNPELAGVESLPETCALDRDINLKKLQDERVEQPVNNEAESITNVAELITSCSESTGVLEQLDHGSGRGDLCNLSEPSPVSSKQSEGSHTKDAGSKDNLGLNLEESEPEEGQLPGEWSGSEESLEDKNENHDKEIDDHTNFFSRGEEVFAVAQDARFEQMQFPYGENSIFLGRSSLEGLSRLKEVPKKKKKKHKKGEGSKKRAREKSSQKYKELKAKKLKPNAAEHSGKAPVQKQGQSERREVQQLVNSCGSSNQAPVSQAKTASKDDVLEDGEIHEPTQTNNGLLFSLVEDEVGLYTTDDIDDQLVAQMEEDGAVKKKRGPETAERMLKRKIAKRKKRAQKERELGIRRPPRNYVSKPVKVLCTHYMKGRCAKGEKCTFSHDAVPLTKQEPCKFLMSHSCLKGEDCPYSHDLKAFPCKFFHTRGLCYDGDNCLFSHGAITDEAREKILKRVEKEKKERASNASGLDMPTPVFSTPLPAEDDPDPLGWGTASLCPSFDVDLQQRSPGSTEALPNFNDEAEYGNPVETSCTVYNNWGTSCYSSNTVMEDGQPHGAHHTSEDTVGKVEHSDVETRTLELPKDTITTSDDLITSAESDLITSATDVAAKSFTGLLPLHRGGLFGNKALEHKKSVPILTPALGSRQLTIESLLGEILKR